MRPLCRKAVGSYRPNWSTKRSGITTDATDPPQALGDIYASSGREVQLVSDEEPRLLKLPFVRRLQICNSSVGNALQTCVLVARDRGNGGERYAAAFHRGTRMRYCSP